MKTFFLSIALLCLSFSSSNAQFASADYALLSVLPLISQSIEKTSFKEIAIAAMIAEKHTVSAEKQLKNYLFQSLRYSDRMVRNGVEGEMLVVVNLASDGTLTNFTLEKSPHVEVTKMVEGALKDFNSVNFKDHWYRGQSQVVIPLSFSLR